MAETQLLYLTLSMTETIASLHDRYLRSYQ